MDCPVGISMGCGGDVLFLGTADGAGALLGDAAGAAGTFQGLPRAPGMICLIGAALLGFGAVGAGAFLLAFCLAGGGLGGFPIAPGMAHRLLHFLDLCIAIDADPGAGVVQILNGGPGLAADLGDLINLHPAARGKGAQLCVVRAGAGADIHTVFIGNGGVGNILHAAQGVDVAAFHTVAGGAGALLDADHQTGGVLDLDPGGPHMTLGCGLAVGIGITANGTGVGGIALICAGGFHDRLDIAMAQGIGIVFLVAVAANAGKFGVALFRAGGSNDLGSIGMMMVQLGDRSAFCLTAGGAGALLFALSFLSGFLYGDPVPEAVAQGCGFVGLIAVAAGAGVDGVAAIFTGGGYHAGCIVVGDLSQGLCLGIVTIGAYAGLFTGFGAGGFLCHLPSAVAVASGGNRFLLAFTATGTGAALAAVFFAGGGGVLCPFAIGMAQGGHFIGPVAVAAGAGEGGVAALRTGGFCRLTDVIVNMIQLGKGLFFLGITGGAGTFCLAFRFFGGFLHGDPLTKAVAQGGNFIVPVGIAAGAGIHGVAAAYTGRLRYFLVVAVGVAGVKLRDGTLFHRIAVGAAAHSLTFRVLGGFQRHFPCAPGMARSRNFVSGLGVTTGAGVSSKAGFRTGRRRDRFRVGVTQRCHGRTRVGVTAGTGVSSKAFIHTSGGRYLLGVFMYMRRCRGIRRLGIRGLGIRRLGIRGLGFRRLGIRGSGGVRLGRLGTLGGGCGGGSRFAFEPAQDHACRNQCDHSSNDHATNNQGLLCILLHNVILPASILARSCYSFLLFLLYHFFPKTPRISF